MLGAEIFERSVKLNGIWCFLTRSGELMIIFVNIRGQPTNFSLPGDQTHDSCAPMYIANGKNIHHLLYRTLIQHLAADTHTRGPCFTPFCFNDPWQ